MENIENSNSSPSESPTPLNIQENKSIDVVPGEKTLTQQKLELEKKKLEIEIKQLEGWNFKKTIVPVLLPPVIGVLAAIASIIIVWKTNIFDVREKGIESKIKYDESVVAQNKVILETYKLTQEGIRLQNEKLKQQKGIDTLLYNISTLHNEKNLLLSNVHILNNTKLKLEDGLEFSKYAINLRDARSSSSPIYTFVYNLIDAIKTNNRFKNRIIDSLQNNLKYDSVKDLSLYILYKGTNQAKYRDELFSRIPLIISRPKYDKLIEYLPTPYMQLYATTDWANPDKKQIINILLEHLNRLALNNKKSQNFFKMQLLNIIANYGYDTSFSFSSTDYNVYWTFLKFNRDLIYTNDSSFDKVSLARNLAFFFPELFYAMTLKSRIEKYENNNLLIANCFSNIMLNTNSIPYGRWVYMDHFYRRSGFSSLVSTLDYNSYYLYHKKEIDSYLSGDFERFRNNKDEFIRCMKEYTF
ncbi:MAG: hypothetical protein NTX03_01840 [Bacteroidetes bacterium]|nr:hypothetical protein [Bacteroidota bacterium]